MRRLVTFYSHNGRILLIIYLTYLFEFSLKPYFIIELTFEYSQMLCK